MHIIKINKIQMKYLIIYNTIKITNDGRCDNEPENIIINETFETEDQMLERIYNLEKENQYFSCSCYSLQELEANNLEKLKLQMQIIDLQKQLKKLGVKETQ